MGDKKGKKPAKAAGKKGPKEKKPKPPRSAARLEQPGSKPSAPAAAPALPPPKPPKTVAPGTPWSITAIQRISHHAERHASSEAKLDEMIKTRDHLKKEIASEKNRSSKKAEMALDFFDALTQIDDLRKALLYHGTRLAETVLKANQGVLIEDPNPEPDDDKDANLFIGPDAARSPKTKDEDAPSESTEGEDGKDEGEEKDEPQTPAV